MSAVTALRRPREHAGRPQLRVVREPRPRHTLVCALLLLVLAGATVFATVAVNALAAGDAVAAAELERQVDDAEDRYADLVAEVSALEDPARIERVAIDQLGMVPADGARFLVLERRLPGDGAVITEPALGTETDPLKSVLSLER